MRLIALGRDSSSPCLCRQLGLRQRTSGVNRPQASFRIAQPGSDIFATERSTLGSFTRPITVRYAP
jgi:hypothetical protein